MTRLLPLLALLAVTPVLAAPDEKTDVARALITALEKGVFEEASKEFDEAMRQALPPAKLGEIWKGIVSQLGSLKSQGTPLVEKLTSKGVDYDILFVPCEFDKTRLFVRLVFNPDRKIGGLSFTSTSPAIAYKAPEYVKRDHFREVETTIGAAPWVLPATVTIPNGPGPFPAAILVHGSGSHDRDETIGPNRPFRDLAWGLASRGIAVLRYEKRTRRYGAQLAKATDLTIKEEVLDDALAAATWLRTAKEIDSQKIVMIGHSLGAMAAPRLGELDPALNKIVLLAGPSRPIADVTLEQVDYVLSLGGEIPAQQKAMLEMMREGARRLKDPKYMAEGMASDSVMGVTLGYWRSVNGLATVETALRIKQPLFILQGERDYQITMEDYKLWQQALTKRQGTHWKSYPKLNHLFMEGSGKAKPEEYSREGHVASEVIEDLAAWIRK